MLKISKEIKIALLAIVAVVMFAFGYNYLKGADMFSSSKKLYVVYDHVQGLTQGSAVQLQGLTIGSVKNISLSKSNPGKVQVELAMEEDVVLPIDSRVEIVSLDLLGTKAISIVKGGAGEKMRDGHVLEGSAQLGMIDKLGASAGPAIDGATKTLASIDATVQNLNNIIDVNTQQHIKSTMANLDKTMMELSQFAQELNKQRGKIEQTITGLNTFTNNLNQNNSAINSIVKNAETTTANLSKLELQSTVTDLRKTLTELQTTLDKVNHGNGSLAMLMNDDKLYKNLKNTLSTTNNLLYDISARPSRYIHVSVFGKKLKNDTPPPVAPNSNQ